MSCDYGASSSVERDPLWRLIARLEELGCRGRGANWQCPAHDDDNPSLSIARGRNDGVVLHCHAGCATEVVLAALGWTWGDLFPQESRIEWAGPRPDVAQLERRYRAGQLRLQRVVLGPLPDNAPGVSIADMRHIAEDMRLLFGLHRAVGERRPMPYSARFAARRMGWPNGHKRANKVIRALVKANTIDRLPDLQPRGGQPRGTAVYAPPLRLIAPEGTREPETILSKPPNVTHRSKSSIRWPCTGHSPSDGNTSGWSQPGTQHRPGIAQWPVARARLSMSSTTIKIAPASAWSARLEG